jgi:hypothetical protein
LNRQQLSAAILAWLHRASFSTPVANPFDVVAGFIALAEQDMNTRLRARCMVVRCNQAIEGQYTTLPCDYLETVDLRLANGGPPIDFTTRAGAANAYWQHTAGLTGAYAPEGFGVDYMPILNPPAYPWGDGQPRFATIVGSEIEWSPFPSLDPNAPPGATPQWPVAEMAYYQRLGLGMDDTDSNSVLSTYPACYIYGSLIQSAPFLRDDTRVSVWKTLYDNALIGANSEHERSRAGQGQRITQQYRRLA